MACLLNSAASCLAAVFNEWRDYSNEPTAEHYIGSSRHLERNLFFSHNQAGRADRPFLFSLPSHVCATVIPQTPRLGEKLLMTLGPNQRMAETAFKVKNEKLPTLASTVLQLSICLYLSVTETVSV